MLTSEIGSGIKDWIELASLVIEVLAIVIIVVTVFYATLKFLFQAYLKRLSVEQRFTQYKHSLGRALLLGLEILVAADIVRTVALDATLRSVTVLGLLVLIRTFLSWSLVVEIEGHWPWRSKESG